MSGTQETFSQARTPHDVTPHDVTPQDVARRRGRVELGAAVLLAAIGGGLALFATSRQWWVEQMPRPTPLPSLREPISGTDVAPWSAAAGLVSLAGAAALLATRRLGRLLVGLLVFVAGVALIMAGLLGLSADGSAGARRIQLILAWPVATVVGGALGMVAGVLTCLRFSRWSTQSTGLSSRYEAPGKPHNRADIAGARLDPSLLWDALDRGVDPTREHAQESTQPPPAGRVEKVK